jgi:uncharacterized protein YegP (UPF0339 family)
MDMWRFRVAVGATSGRHSWWLVTDSGARVAQAGDTYDSAEDARRACLHFRDGVMTWRFEVYAGGTGEQRWRVKQGRHVIARSGSGYATTTEAVNAAHGVREGARYAFEP